MIRKFVVCTILILSTNAIRAQLTIAEYVDVVMEYSHTIARAVATVEGAEAEYRVAKCGMLPAVSLSSDATFGFVEDGTTWSLRADVVQPIYNGGGRSAVVKQRERLFTRAESALDGSVLAVRYEAEVTYLLLSRAEIYRQAMRDYVAIVERLREIVKHRFEEGYTSKSDLLQVESRLSDGHYLLSEAEQRWRIALHNFNLLRGEAAATDVALSEGIFDSFAMPKREDVALIITDHPDYLSAMATLESAQYGVAVRRAEYLPSINAGLFGLCNPTMKGSADGGVLLSLNIPIFHFMERREAMRSARSEVTISDAQLAEVVDNITQNESNGWANLEYSHMRVEAVQRNLEVARENLEISTYAYHEGVATILDVLQAQISWLQIYENAIAAEYDYAVAIASYRYIVGK